MSKKLGGAQKYENFDMVSIGFGVLLFILENMLIGREECSIDDIAGILQMVIKDSYGVYLTQEEAKEMAFYIRDAISGSGGEVVDFKFKNLETKKDESIPLKFIDTSYYEIKIRQVQTYRPGHGSAFKQEIYSEFRINVTQLY